GDVLMWLMKTLLTSGCTNQRGAGHIKNDSNSDDVITLAERKSELEIKKKKLESLIDEKHRMSTHSLLITISEFESRTLTLMKLARNSIIYLSLALHLGKVRISGEILLG
ncbi:LA2681 family HEPN domain-containing protein, partial [Klebsiella michiganensis]